MQVMISLPTSWIPWVERIGGINKLNEAIANKDTKLLGEDFLKALILPSARIPGQALSSFEAMEVVKFMPHYHGPKVILPPEITIKSGSDFDVDKLTTYFNNFNLDKKTKQPYLKKDDINKLHEILNISLLHPDRFSDLIRPNTSKTIKKLANKSKESRNLTTLEELSGNPTWTNTLEWWYNIQKGYEFWTSKANIAKTAVQNAAHALEQKFPLTLNKLIPLFFEGQQTETGYQTGFIKDSDGHIISSNFAEFLTAFVDAAKDPFVFELVDEWTFNGIAALNRIGVNNSCEGLFED